MDRPGTPEAPAAYPPRKVITLAEDAKNRVLSLVEKAMNCWNSFSPSVQATWLGRMAVLLAEAGFRDKAIEQLNKARNQIPQIRDSISVDSSLCQLAGAFAKAGSALEEEPLFDRAMQMVEEIKSSGFRGIALAEMFGFLAETGSAALAEKAKKRLMTQMDFLTGFDYTLTVGSVVNALSKIPSAKAEVVKLLETGLERGKSDKTFADTAVRDVALSYAKAGRDLRDEKILGRALEIAKGLTDPAARACIFEDSALAYAQMGLIDEAQQALSRLEKEVPRVKDSWDQRRANTSRRVVRVVVGVTTGDMKLVDEGMRDVEKEGGKELTLISIADALVELARARSDASIVARAGEVAEKLDKPFDRYTMLVMRVAVLCHTGHQEEADALIERACIEAEKVSEENERGSAYLSVAEAVLQMAVQ
jgi:tetratricopeptide (TPR) repeat protein